MREGPHGLVAAATIAQVPIGGVILWWGLETEVPENFEVCDGRVPVTRDAVLKTRKPDLRGRFPMGAPDEFQFRPWEDNTGGSQRIEATTSSTEITEVAPHEHAMANHEHSIDHLHNITNHTHSTPKSSHDHTTASHTHTIEAHTHPLGGKFTDITYVAGDTTSDPTVKVLVLDSKTPDRTGDNADGRETKSVVVKINPADVKASTTGGTALTTSPPTESESGPPMPRDTSEEGEVVAHRHDVRVEGARPPFTQFIFIIRVK